MPPDKTYVDKSMSGQCAGESMIGRAEVIQGHANREKAVIGLLLRARQ
jgi:hypothetical protein